MKLIIATLSMVALATILWIGTPKIVDDVVGDTESAEIKYDFTDRESSKAYLRTLIDSDRNYTIMREIIHCESSWDHYWQETTSKHKEGEVKLSNGNIGFAQINVVHLERFATIGLDPNNPDDNLKIAVALFNEQGITPWKKWSGPCFIPRLEKLGIRL